MSRCWGLSRADGRQHAPDPPRPGGTSRANHQSLSGSAWAPVHIGDPAAIGIRDVQRPDFGDAVPIAPEVPVFWACGVTPQAVVMHVKPDLAITHAPGYMFITDRRDNELAML